MKFTPGIMVGRVSSITGIIGPLAAPVHKLAQGAAGATFTSATGLTSHTAAPSTYMFIMGWAYHTTTDPVKPTFSSSGSASAFTWTELGDHTYSTGANPRLRMTVWYADVSAGFTTSAQFTIASTGAATVGFEACIWADVNTTFLSNIAFGDHPTGITVATLAALNSSSSAVYTGATGHTTFTTAISTPTGYTSLHSITINQRAQKHLYNIAPSSATVAYPATSNLTFTTCFALELRGMAHKFVFSTAPTAANSKTGTTLACAAASITAGTLVVVAVASDNAGTTDATGADNIASVTDSVGGNTWTLAAGYRNGQGTAQTGAHASIWYSKLTNTLGVGATITVTNTTTAYARAVQIAAYTITVSAGGTVSVAGSAGAAGDAGVDPSAVISGLASDEYLWVGCAADETTAIPGVATGFTATTGTNTSGGAANLNMGVCQYYSIETATGKTFAPATAADAAAVLVAFKVT